MIQVRSVIKKHRKNNFAKKNPELRESLKSLYREYGAQKYLVAVFLSGERNLTDATGDLLCHNRKCLARVVGVSLLKKDGTLSITCEKIKAQI